MTIKELIEQLQKHPNQEAKVSIVVGDDETNIVDTYELEVHSIDVLEYVELFSHMGTDKQDYIDIVQKTNEMIDEFEMWD